MTVSVEKLYELCEVLDGAKDEVGTKAKEYNAILAGAKGPGLSEKKLASQLIVRYFPRFPELKDAALDALFELCEDEDANLRKFVVRNLVGLCKEPGPAVSKVADVLTQLLQTGDAEEARIVQSSLGSLLLKFPKETIATIFGCILAADEESPAIRDRSIKFLALKLPSLPPASATPELQALIVEKAKAVMEDVTGDEFVLLIHILSSLSSMATVTGRASLLELVTKQASLDEPFSASDPSRVDQICQCTKQAAAFFSKNVPSTAYVAFLLKEVIPCLDEIGGETAEATKLELARALADLVPFTGTLDEPESLLSGILKTLMARLPLPPSLEETGEKKENGEGSNDGENIPFSEVEALLLSLHGLAKRHPEFLGKADEAKAELLRDFRKRLSYMARAIQVYTKKLQGQLQALPKAERGKEESKMKALALRTTSNINLLLRDLILTSNLSYRANVSPSWKPMGGAAPAAKGRKLIGAPDKSETPAKKAKGSEQAHYTPPGGKFSQRAGSFQESGGGGGGNRRGRGGFGRGGYGRRRF